MIVCILLFFISFVLIFISKLINRDVKSIKNRYNIQQGKIAYSDLNKPARPFFSKKFRIAGKPDYVIQKKDKYIPVELKTGNHNSPQKNHVFQLASYCHLIEEYYGIFVPYGVLVYNNDTQYKIPFNPQLRFELEHTIKKMRYVLKTNKITRNHDNIFRCKNCSMRQCCNNKIE